MTKAAEYTQKWREKNPEAVKKYGKFWTKNNPEKVKAQRQRYYKKNKEKILQRNRQWLLEHPGKQKEYQENYIRSGKKLISSRRKRAGFTQELFESRLAGQKNLCAICKISLDVGVPHADHDHKTHKQRGILCRKCNLGIGYFNDDPVALESAIEYLKKWKAMPGG